MALSDQTDSKNVGQPLSKEAQMLCPLCGGDNQCAIAAGRAPESCWCQEADISKEALAAVPEQAVNKVCVCPACGRATQEPEDER